VFAEATDVQSISENVGGGMGGMSSGRRRVENRGSVENALRLDMRSLRRLGFLKTGSTSLGGIAWMRDGKQSSAIRVTVNLVDVNDAFVRLEFSVNMEDKIQWVRLDAVPCRFGGYRFFFRCPFTGCRVATLLCAGEVFGSRRSHRLTYASQSEGPLHRLYRARAKAEARAHGGRGFPIPRGANRERVLERWAACEEAADALFISESMRRFDLTL